MLSLNRSFDPSSDPHSLYPYNNPNPNPSLSTGIFINSGNESPISNFYAGERERERNMNIRAPNNPNHNSLNSNPNANLNQGLTASPSGLSRQISNNFLNYQTQTIMNNAGLLNNLDGPAFDLPSLNDFNQNPSNSLNNMNLPGGGLAMSSLINHRAQSNDFSSNSFNGESNHLIIKKTSFTLDQETTHNNHNQTHTITSHSSFESKIINHRDHNNNSMINNNSSYYNVNPTSFNNANVNGNVNVNGNPNNLDNPLVSSPSSIDSLEIDSNLPFKGFNDNNPNNNMNHNLNLNSNSQNFQLFAPLSPFKVDDQSNNQNNLNNNNKPFQNNDSFPYTPTINNNNENNNNPNNHNPRNNSGYFLKPLSSINEPNLASNDINNNNNNNNLLTPYRVEDEFSTPQMGSFSLNNNNNSFKSNNNNVPNQFTPNIRQSFSNLNQNPSQSQSQGTPSPLPSSLLNVNNSSLSSLQVQGYSLGQGGGQQPPRKRGRKPLPVYAQPAPATNAKSINQNNSGLDSEDGNSKRKTATTHLVADRMRRARLSQAVDDLRTLLNIHSGDAASIVQQSAEQLRSYMSSLTLKPPINPNAPLPSPPSRTQTPVNPLLPPIDQEAQNKALAAAAATAAAHTRCQCLPLEISLNPLSCKVNGAPSSDMVMFRMNAHGMFEDVNEEFERVTGFHRSFIIGKSMQESPLHFSLSLVPSPEYIQKIATECQFDLPPINPRNVPQTNNQNHLLLEDNTRMEEFDEDVTPPLNSRRSQEDHLPPRRQTLDPAAIYLIDPLSPTLQTINGFYHKDHSHATQSVPSNFSPSSNSKSLRTRMWQYPVPYNSTFPIPRNSLIMGCASMCTRFESQQDLFRQRDFMIDLMTRVKSFIHRTGDSVPMIVHCHSASGRNCEWLVYMRGDFATTPGSQTPPPPCHFNLDQQTSNNAESPNTSPHGSFGKIITMEESRKSMIDSKAHMYGIVFCAPAAGRRFVPREKGCSGVDQVTKSCLDQFLKEKQKAFGLNKLPATCGPVSNNNQNSQWVS